MTNFLHKSSPGERDFPRTTSMTNFLHKSSPGERDYFLGCFLHIHHPQDNPYSYLLSSILSSKHLSRHLYGGVDVLLRLTCQIHPNPPNQIHCLKAEKNILYSNVKKCFMGPNPNGPLSNLLARVIRYSGFFGVGEKWVLLGISWIFELHDLRKFCFQGQGWPSSQDAIVTTQHQEFHILRIRDPYYWEVGQPKS